MGLITPRIVKLTYVIILPLTHIITLSLAKGIFPDDMKVAKVIPIYKEGNKTIVNNYHPISILPIFLNVLERLMYNTLKMFINKHNILYDYQFGFRKKYSASMALVQLVDKIAINNGDYILGVFLDFNKAFDTVDHKILLISVSNVLY